MYLVYFVGFSQNAYEGDTSSNTDDPNADGKAVKFLKQQLSERKGTMKMANPKYNITSANLHDIVTARLRKEMTALFFWLPESTQCNLLKSVSKAAHCSVPDIAKLLSNLTGMKHALNVSCPLSTSRENVFCSLSNRRKVVKTINHELLKLFRALPSPFKCHVINTIALTYNIKGKRHLRSGSLTFSVSEAQNQVAKIFPSVSLPQNCSDIDIDHLIPSIPPVNITVNLTNGDKNTWLISLAKKGPAIYKTVLEYQRETVQKDKVLGPGSNAQYLAENKEMIDSAQLVIAGVYGGSKTFSVLFRLKVKRESNHLREMRSTYKIIHALAAKKQKGLKEIFNANIIAVRLSGERTNVTKSPPISDKWTFKKIEKAKDLFPTHLSEYYKQLGKPARCLVVYYISLKIRKTPIQVEMFYASFGRFSRKHTCYYVKRNSDIDSTITVPITDITEERFTRNNRWTTNMPSMTYRTLVRPNGSDSALDNSVKVIRNDFSTLQIALFTLLGLLCTVILVFTINCVVSPLKPKSPEDNTVPNGTVQNAVFLNSATLTTRGNNEDDSVHFIKRIQGNHRHYQQSDSQHLSTKGTGISCRNHTCLELQSVTQPNQDSGVAHRTGSKMSQSKHDNVAGNISTNIRTHKENEYCLDSSQLHNRFNATLESPWEKRSSCQTTGQRSRREEEDDHHSIHASVDRRMGSQGKAISCVSISEASCKAHPHRTVHYCSSQSGESQTVVVTMLDCAEGLREEQV